MRSRLIKFVTTVAALAALAIGGSAIATAAQGSHKTTPPPATAVPAEQPGAETADSSTNAGAETADTSTKADAETADTAEPAGQAETPADTSAQDAACKAAGISPTADNVNYDDATGKCSIDTGANSGN